MRAAVIFGLDSSEKDLQPFRKIASADWRMGLPANSSEADAVLIFGGDGTVHRHLPHLVRLQLPVLIVPCGSGNDFARALNLSHKKKSLAAWREFVSSTRNVRSIDLGVITAWSKESARSFYFCCVGGVGVDTEVARRANRLPRWLRAHGSYVLALPPALFRFRAMPMKISVSSSGDSATMAIHNERPIILAAFANAPAYGGGMKIAPRALLDDRMLDLCIVTDMDKFKLFCLFPTVYFGKHLRMIEVDYQQTNRVKIEIEEPLDVYADGEYVCQTPIEVTVAPRALRVIVPPSR